MKKLILILLFLWILSSSLFAQTVTNKIQNMATIMLSNSTLYVGSSNTILNGTGYPIGDILIITGADGSIRMDPATPFHGRVNIYWTTNLAGTLASWSLGQDFIGQNTHTFGIQDNFNNKIPFLIASNQTIEIDIPTMVLSSNLFVTNNISAAAYQITGNPGATAWSTNVGVGQTNVLVFTNGLFMGQFTIP